jgi:hypothetical protein
MNDTVGYTGSTLQLVPHEGTLKLLYWSPTPTLRCICSYDEALDQYLEEATDDPERWVDKWDYLEDIHG